MGAMNPVAGEILIVDKPYGWSSFHVVKKLRGVLLARLRPYGVDKLKVGHAGTLDPLATGVMIVCTGKTTGKIDALQAGVKTYMARIALGATTPSFDLETPVDCVYPTSHITRDLVEAVLSKFRGSIRQVPPVYSAVKVDGKRAYKMARQGMDVELKAKTLQIEALDILEFTPEEIAVRIVCSKGTYIRALARDIGNALGSGAHLTSLCRESVGDFSLAEALTISDTVELLATSPMEVERSVANEAKQLCQVDPLTAGSFSGTRDRMDILPWHLRRHDGHDESSATSSMTAESTLQDCINKN